MNLNDTETKSFKRWRGVTELEQRKTHPPPTAFTGNFNIRSSNSPPVPPNKVNYSPRHHFRQQNRHPSSLPRPTRTYVRVVQYLHPDQVQLIELYQKVVKFQPLPINYFSNPTSDVLVVTEALLRKQGQCYLFELSVIVCNGLERREKPSRAQPKFERHVLELCCTFEVDVR